LTERESPVHKGAALKNRAFFLALYKAMCGIREEASPVLLDGLRRLEYRGYDSAGIATPEGLRKTVGRIAALAALIKNDPLTGSLGIGHTRWATHGRVTEASAHPHLLVFS
jgi:glutamine---fructose-6-phosphate transaminase (isomerizing)